MSRKRAQVRFLDWIFLTHLMIDHSIFPLRISLIRAFVHILSYSHCNNYRNYSNFELSLSILWLTVDMRNFTKNLPSRINRVQLYKLMSVMISKKIMLACNLSILSLALTNFRRLLHRSATGRKNKLDNERKKEKMQKREQKGEGKKLGQRVTRKITQC